MLLFVWLHCHGNCPFYFPVLGFFLMNMFTVHFGDLVICYLFLSFSQNVNKAHPGIHLSLITHANDLSCYSNLMIHWNSIWDKKERKVKIFSEKHCDLWTEHVICILADREISKAWLWFAAYSQESRGHFSLIWTNWC